MHRTLREEKGHYLKNYILLLMTNNKRVLLTIGLAHRNYKTVIAPKLVGWKGRWRQQIWAFVVSWWRYRVKIVCSKESHTDLPALVTNTFVTFKIKNQNFCFYWVWASRVNNYTLKVLESTDCWLKLWKLQ